MGKAALLAAVLAFTACGAGDATDDGAVTTSTASATTSAPTTTTTVTTTTTTDPCEGEPISIDERGLQLVAGCQYRTEQFVFPITFDVAGDGWLSFAEPEPRVVYLGIDSDEDGGVEANIAIISYRAGTEEDPFSAILAVEDDPYGVESVSSPVERTVAGIDALTIDVLGEEKFEIPGTSGCSTQGVRYYGGDVGDGYKVGPAGSPTRFEYGMPACVVTRVWALTVDDIPITIVAAALDNNRFEEFMPIFEDFLENSVTFGEGDG